ncbi:unnamed protein product [Litomosoides sigmodontis]|uniref:Uncharacterized protein n=1 Tax=Litomosoides sigmodontis TaxID=42156 RepID=A0A3P6STX3_LITSI|nr:unnamed protein product [Litomosoides sigmodontis]
MIPQTNRRILLTGLLRKPIADRILTYKIRIDSMHRSPATWDCLVCPHAVQGLVLRRGLFHVCGLGL